MVYLQPHQYAVGTPNGCEKIIHAMSHSLTNQEQRQCCMSVDFSNAFNTVDRGMLLRKLYSTIELEQAWRIGHFAYSTPSLLLLGDKSQSHLTSSNGVRQGDPLSTLLFSLAIHDTYDSVAKSASVTLYGFVDD